MKRAWAVAASIGLSLGMAAAAEATIIGGRVTDGAAFDNGGVFTKLLPPIGPVGENNYNTYHLYGFDELQNVVLSEPLQIALGLSIEAGTLISSHYVFFDPVSRTRVFGYVDFDAVILGVITGRDYLAASDFLGDPSTIYGNPGGRGFEANDHIFDDPDPQRLSLRLRASTPGDYIRVITQGSPVTPMPEPGTLVLLSLGLLGIGGLGARRRRSLKSTKTTQR